MSGFSKRRADIELEMTMSHLQTAILDVAKMMARARTAQGQAYPGTRERRETEIMTSQANMIAPDARASARVDAQRMLVDLANDARPILATGMVAVPRSEINPVEDRVIPRHVVLIEVVPRSRGR